MKTAYKIYSCSLISIVYIAVMFQPFNNIIQSNIPTYTVVIGALAIIAILAGQIKHEFSSSTNLPEEVMFATPENHMFLGVALLNLFPILLFLGKNIDIHVAIAAYIGLLIIVVVLNYHLYFANPLLWICGYRLYVVILTKNKTVWIMSKSIIIPGDFLSLVPLGDKFYFNVKKYIN